MKKMILMLLPALLLSCGPTVYKAQNFEQTRNAIKTVAILPFNVSIDPKRLPKGMTIETLKESEEKTGYDIQGEAYKWLLHRQQDYTVNIQDVDKTDAIIKQNNIGYPDIALQDKGNLCKMLGVDAVLSGKANLSKPMSEGAAIALDVIAFGGSTNKATTSLTIHDSTGGLLWKYDYEASGAIGSSAEKLTDELMKNASKKFPYKTTE
jgi:hypothetical protein